MESRFGHDFSRVRVHTDARSTEAASAIDARAFTAGRDIVFGVGRYAPDTESGRRLLSHELTHVLQQQSGVQLNNQVERADDLHEWPADVEARDLSARGAVYSVPKLVRAGAIPQGTFRTIQLQPVSTEEGASQQRSEAVTLPEVTITAERPRESDKIIEEINALQAQLIVATSITGRKLIVSKIKALFVELQSSPISPTPKRDYVAGPIKFSEFGEFFYEFGFESMQDKHWRQGWEAIAKFAAGEAGILIEVAELFMAEEREEREEVAGGIMRDKALEEISEQGVPLGKYMIKKGAPKSFAKGVAIPVKSLSKFVTAALTAYEVYKANTEGPSPHAAALETTALIMGSVYGSSDARDGAVRKGGFIPTPTTSYCRVARQQLGPFPQIKDRRLAFDLMGNRIYERMRNLIAPKHIETPEAFYAFRNTQMERAYNIVDAADADLTGRKVRLVQAKEKDLVKMEEMAELWEGKIDMNEPIKMPTHTMRSDQFRGIGITNKQRYGLKEE